MNETKMHLVNQALQKYTRIYPCASKESFSECFTVEGDRLYFWFNDETNDTHLLAADVQIA